MRFVYMSFEGRFSDHPRALFEALRERRTDDEHVWLVDEAHAGGFPADVELVPYGGAACVQALESADVVVANTHLDLDWDKAEETTYLQTWHGTPLKRIHHDVLWAPEGRLERLDEDVARWDALLSPSPFATRIFRRAFRWEGEVIEAGSPRDDALLAPDAEAVRGAVREALGLPDGARALLYAPTWRDDEVFGSDGGPLALHLDPAAVADALGPDAHVLLRTHYMQTGRLAALEHPRVHDVSWHPDVRDLHLAADVLVTDYSSLMFDWVVTGKPIVHYAYDLERYAGEVRGFCVDLREEAAGPVVRTQDELVAALGRALPGPRDADYAAFVERYCPWEDGRASERALDALLTLRADRPSPEAPGPARR